MSKDVMGVQEVSPGYECVAENPVVPVGYKHSASGLIPEEWEALELEQALTLQRGYDLPYRLRKVGNVPIISSSGASGLHDVEKVGPPGVVTGRYGTIGEVFYVKQAYWPLNTTLYVKDFKGNDSRFIYYLLGTVDFVSHSGKSGVPGVNRNDVHKEQIALPPIHEQRAIATALSDVDALLEELDRLIAKKRDIKQAAMQQLLTGETRLPGFEGEWEAIPLGSLGRFLKGSGVKRDDAMSGNIPCIRYGEIYTLHNDVIREFHSWISDEVAQSAVPIQKGDVLFAGSGETKEEIGKSVALIDEVAAYAGGDIVILRTNSADPAFLGYALNQPSVIRQKSRFGQGDAVVHISAASLAKVVVKVPRFEEQEAIAAVLSDMDTEIQALEQRRSKTAELKQGMMQELLTGRTRLV